MGEKDAQHLVVLSSVDTLGVHAQIVGEISSQEKSRDFYFLSLAVFSDSEIDVKIVEKCQKIAWKIVQKCPKIVVSIVENKQDTELR